MRSIFRITITSEVRFITLIMNAFRCPPELLLRNAVRSRSSMSASYVAGKASYRAALCTELGKPLSISPVSQKPLPVGTVRMAVHNTGINFADVLTVQGKYQVKPPLPFIPGNEVAGRVVEVGEGVENIKVGDRVAGMSVEGGFSDEAVAMESSVYKIPDNVSYEMASALSCTYGTAWMALVHRAHIQPRDTVLVTAAAGGVGTAIVDIAVNVFNCTVIAACGGEDKCSLMKRRGAHHVIDYRKENMKERVLDITNGSGVNIICDNVGGQKEFRTLLSCVAFEGRIVIIGFAGGTIPQIPANLIMLKSIAVLGVFWGSYSMRDPAIFKQSIQEVIRYCGAGKVQPHIGARFQLEKVNDALKYIQERKSTGKVVLSMR